MSFGISAAAWGMIAAGTVAATTAYSADQSRKAANKQERAIEDAKAADAAQLAQAEAGANAARVADKTRRRKAGSLLSTGAPSDPMAPPPTSVLGAGRVMGPGQRSTLGGP